MTLQQAVESGSQQHVRQITVALADVQAGQAWAEQSRDQAAAVRAGGRLAGVRSVVLSLFPKVEPAAVAGHIVESSDALVRSAVDAFGDLAAAIRAAMPNVCRVRVGGWEVAPATSTSEQHSQRLYALAHGLAGARTTAHLALLRQTPVATLPDALPADGALRSIEVVDVAVLGRSAELIRRSAASLERLHVDVKSSTEVDGLFVRSGSSGGGRGQTLVYPRLRRLEIFYGRTSAGAGPTALADNPVPSLEVLHISRNAPVPVAFFLAANRTRVRQLDVRIDRDLVRALLAEGVGGTGGFASLDRIALWSSTSSPTAQAGLCREYTRMLQLCPRVRAVRIQCHAMSPLQEAHAGIRFPHSVQHLDLDGLEFSADQAAAVVCGCPRLRTARLQLADYPGAPDEPTADEDIARLRERAAAAAAGGAPSVRRLALASLAAASPRRGAELAVLLADLLPSVARLVLPGRLEWPGCDFAAELEAARARAPYRGRAHLAALEFVL